MLTCNLAIYAVHCLSLRKADSLVSVYALWVDLLFYHLLTMMLCTKLNDVIFLREISLVGVRDFPFFYAQILRTNSTNIDRFFMHDSAMLNCLRKTLFFKHYVPILSKKRTWRQNNKRKKGAFINSAPKFRIRMKTCV